MDFTITQADIDLAGYSFLEFDSQSNHLCVDNVSLFEIATTNIVQTTGTNIEEIQPGDTCRFLNFSTTLSDIFRDNMLITAVNYALEYAEITVELVKSGLLDIQSKQGRTITGIGNGDWAFPPPIHSIIKHLWRTPTNSKHSQTRTPRKP